KPHVRARTLRVSDALASKAASVSACVVIDRDLGVPWFGGGRRRSPPAAVRLPPRSRVPSQPRPAPASRGAPGPAPRAAPPAAGCRPWSLRGRRTGRPCPTRPRTEAPSPSRPSSWPLLLVAAVQAAVDDLLRRGYDRALAGSGTKSAPRGRRRRGIVQP